MDELEQMRQQLQEEQLVMLNLCEDMEEFLEVVISEVPFENPNRDAFEIALRLLRESIGSFRARLNLSPSDDPQRSA
jgi:hypothetical protein